jgi:hypothetical protein
MEHSFSFRVRVLSRFVEFELIRGGEVERREQDKTRQNAQGKRE